MKRVLKALWRLYKQPSCKWVAWIDGMYAIRDMEWESINFAPIAYWHGQKIAEQDYGYHYPVRLNGFRRV